MTATGTMGAALAAGNTPPWMHRHPDSYDLAADADTDTDTAEVLDAIAPDLTAIITAARVAALTTERYGTLAAATGEAAATPPPVPPLRRRTPTRTPGPDDELTLARRRRALLDAIPYDYPTAATRGAA